MNWVIIGSGNGFALLRSQAIAWTNDDWTTEPNGNNLEWNLNETTTIFMQENEFEKMVCRVAAILSPPPCVQFQWYMIQILAGWKFERWKIKNDNYWFELIHVSSISSNLHGPSFWIGQWQPGKEKENDMNNTQLIRPKNISFLQNFWKVIL